MCVTNVLREVFPIFLYHYTISELYELLANSLIYYGNLLNNFYHILCYFVDYLLHFKTIFVLYKLVDKPYKN